MSGTHFFGRKEIGMDKLKKLNEGEYTVMWVRSKPQKNKKERMYNFFKQQLGNLLPTTRSQMLSPMVSSKNVSV